jgi:hypothetical protein
MLTGEAPAGRMCETGMKPVSSAFGTPAMGDDRRTISGGPDYPVGLSLPPVHAAST